MSQDESLRETLSRLPRQPHVSGKTSLSLVALQGATLTCQRDSKQRPKHESTLAGA